MEMFEVIENFRSEQASVQKLFGGEGRKVRNTRTDPDRLLEAMKFVKEVEDGRKPMSLLKEAMSTSDFPILFADVLDRQLLGAYQDITPVWSSFIRRGRVRDFRKAKRFSVDGAEGILPEVDEREEYPEEGLIEAFDEVSVRKYGRRLDLSWEALINDDLDAFRRNPDRLARAARRTESFLATGLYVDANGPHASLYGNTFGSTGDQSNKLAGNPPLTFEGLQAGFQQFANIKDEDGQPIVVEAVVLVVPPALQIPAQNLLNATELQLGDVTQGNTPVLRLSNWMQNKVQLVVDPYIPYHATNANANTSWFLFANPSVVGRAAAELTFLAGNETPALYERMPDARLVGGGGEAVESFDDDSRAWRIRHVVGGARFTNTGGWRVTVASDGTGTNS